MLKVGSLIIKHLPSYIGWLFTINITAVVSMVGWIPAITGISGLTYIEWVFYASVPLALWCEIHMADHE